MYKTVYKEFEYITKLQRASAYCCVSVDVAWSHRKKKTNKQIAINNKKKRLNYFLLTSYISYFNSITFFVLDLCKTLFF